MRRNLIYIKILILNFLIFVFYFIWTTIFNIFCFVRINYICSIIKIKSNFFI